MTEQNSPLSEDKFDRVERDAVRWFTRINHGDGDPDVVREFHDWLAESQDHRDKYDAICEVMEQAREFTDDPLMKAFYRKEAMTGPRARGREKPVWRRRLVAWWAQGMPGGPVKGVLMASFAALVVLVVLQFGDFGPSGKTYQTGAGELKQVTLADQSVLKLNTKTIVTVAYDDKQRLIILRSGQATFTVARNPDRPFVVSAGLGQVTALGTEFDIHKTDDGLYINLIEGRVRVRKISPENELPAAPHSTKDSEKASVILETDDIHAAYVAVTAQGISEVKQRDSLHVTAWQQHKIFFEDKSLSDVIKELNRYSAREIILQDLSRSDELITAVVPTDIPAALVMIKKHFNLVEVGGDPARIILISGQDAKAGKENLKNI